MSRALCLTSTVACSWAVSAWLIAQFRVAESN